MDRTLIISVLALLCGVLAQTETLGQQTVTMPLLFDTVKVEVKKERPVSAVPSKPLINFYKGDLATLQKKASRENKPYIVKFETSWCINCRKLDKETFTDHSLSRYINKNMFAISLDAETNFDGIELAKTHRVNAYPTVLVFGPDGQLVKRYEGLFAPAYFLEQLRSL